jgi:DNA-binding transcriptional LysR family regulator
MAGDWSAVELRHLATLSAIGRERSFSRAAESLGYTQSAVSQQVARLERLVGHRLVEKAGGVADDDAGSRRRREIDAVEPHAPA